MRTRTCDIAARAALAVLTTTTYNRSTSIIRMATRIALVFSNTTEHLLIKKLNCSMFSDAFLEASCKMSELQTQMVRGP